MGKDNFQYKSEINEMVIKYIKKKKKFKYKFQKE